MVKWIAPGETWGLSYFRVYIPVIIVYYQTIPRRLGTNWRLKMRKWKREIGKAIKPYGYKVVATSGKGHYILENAKTGHTLVTPVTPRNMERSKRNVLADIKRWKKGHWK
jgi:hypothetical protein